MPHLIRITALRLAKPLISPPIIPPDFFLSLPDFLFPK
jgi:hypothetical protein